MERTPKFWSIKYRVSQNENDPQFLTNQKAKFPKNKNNLKHPTTETQRSKAGK